jgi:hypothetical protein
MHARRSASWSFWLASVVLGRRWSAKSAARFSMDADLPRFAATLRAKFPEKSFHRHAEIAEAAMVG